MISKELNWHIVFYSKYTLDNTVELKEYLESDLFKNICNNLPEKTIITLGWDWTMLRAIKNHYNSWYPFLWINFWNKWFLLNSKEYVNPQSEYVKTNYSLMEAKILIWDKEYSDIFINELNVSAWWWKMLDLCINLSNRNNINIIWDWIVISTPTGSTGYNSSLRWPIIPHSIPVLSITAKAPWEPRWQHPIVITDDETIEITRPWRISQIECFADWRKMYIWEDEGIKIKVKKLEKCITFLIEKDYKNIWDNKVLIEQGFKTKKL